MIEFLQANWLTLVFLGGIAAFFILFRNRTTKVDGVDAILGQDEPVIVEVIALAGSDTSQESVVHLHSRSA